MNRWKNAKKLVLNFFRDLWLVICGKDPSSEKWAKFNAHGRAFVLREGETGISSKNAKVTVLLRFDGLYDSEEEALVGEDREGVIQSQSSKEITKVLEDTLSPYDEDEEKEEVKEDGGEPPDAA